MKKGNAEAIANYCQLEFIPPVPKLINVNDKTKSIIQSVKEMASDVKKENLQLKRGLEGKENEIEKINYQIENLESFVDVSLSVLKKFKYNIEMSLQSFLQTNHF